MVRSNELSTSNIFSGVRFVLFGFDTASEEQYRLEITQRGGVDLGKYDPTCTHVIVCGRVYDDPICVMARDDGKIVVTETWVDDILDFGVRADETKVLYKPVKDLDGIPGSKSLHICLTGYQRQEREDIMRMVTMMGARFSKPLIANQITHLICYKFEGEKYELAKRVNIKLVNHCWLEDCLKAWAILPIDNYTKSGWELEMMEAEARDSEEETDNDMVKNKALDRTVNRQTPSLHNRPSTSVIPNPPVRSPAPRQSGNPGLRGHNLIPSTTQSKDDSSKMMANLSLKPPHSVPTFSVTPNLSSQSPAPGPENNSEIQVAMSGTDIGTENMINVAVKSLSLHSGPTISAGQLPVESQGVMPLEGPVPDRLIKNPDSGYCMPASASALDPPVKPPVPRPFNNQGARHQLVTMLHEESGSKKMNLHVKSPFTTGSHTPTAVSEPLSQNSDLQGKSVAPNSSKDPENLNKVKGTDSKSEKMVNPPIVMSAQVTFNPILSASTRKIQDAGIRGEMGNLDRTSDEKTKAGEIDNSNVKTTLVTKARDPTMVQTPLECISPGKGISLTTVGQSKIEGTSCINSQKEVRREGGCSLETSCTAKSATPSLSENKEIASSELISSTNLVVTGNSTTTPQIGTGSRKGLSVPDESLSETAKCQDVSSCGDGGSCGTRFPVLTNSSTLKRIYTRKLRKKSASPEEQQSDPSVNTTTPKVILGILPKSLGNENGDANRDGEIEKIVEQSCVSLPQKRKTSDSSICNIPLVVNEFEELEHITSLPKEREGCTTEHVQSGISNGSGNDAAKMVSKTPRTKRTSLKCARPPRCSPSNLNAGLYEMADKRQVEKKMEPVTDKQPNILDFSSHFASLTDNIGNPASTFAVQHGDSEMRHAPDQSKKAEVENKMLEIKGLSPDSLEAELNKCPSDASSDPCNNHQLSSGDRIKKAVAKRSMKQKLKNPSKHGFLKVGINSGAKQDNSNCTMKVGINEMRPAPDQSKKAEVENKMLEIKGFSPDSLEVELNKCPSDASSDSCNNHKQSAGARIKKAVAKRSMKQKLQNPSKHGFLKVGINSGAKQDNSNCIMKVGTSDKGEVSDARPQDADSDILREVRSNSSVNPQTDNKSPENDKAETPDRRQKIVRKNISQKFGAEKRATSEDYKKSSIKKDELREKMTKVSKSTSNKSNVTMDWLLTSTELDPEKENKPDTADCDSVLKCNRKGIPIQKECTGGEVTKLMRAASPVTCFILSGHRLQRKEFQAVIKKLRGRVCRDSHNWSFQATHFIVPGPVRRTEKFFAAAASGRWILKMEYLTASNEAGRFIEEEPYEWHGSGMTEDSSISLEAPRKWRLMREKTGHGAFYGMQIVIYGECIAPSLDTMKRVIKAGDGTILATSPPYTRILKTNSVDFAVVPAITPSNDPWVCEFLNHQIPCVTSDYIVEYVCKPGYSLSKHVLFQTQEWADKSLQKLVKSCEELVCEFSSPLKLKGSNQGNDLACAVCGSHDREELMLICGDESGSIGCGIGTHIDCCDPPLQVVPDDDWFCCKCSKIRSKKSSLDNGNKRSKKG